MDRTVIYKPLDRYDKIFTVFRNMLLMMKMRGCDIDDYELYLDFQAGNGNYYTILEDFKREYLEFITKLTPFFFLNGDGETYTTVSFLQNHVTPDMVESILAKIFMADIEAENVKHKIFITFEKLKSDIVKKITIDGVSQIIEHRLLLCSPIMNIHAPEYEIIDLHELKEEGIHNINTLPKIPKDEAFVRICGLNPGAIIKITNKVFSSGGPATKTLEYRIVADAVSKISKEKVPSAAP